MQPAVRRKLLTAGCQLATACCLLPAACCLLPTACCLLPTALAVEIEPLRLEVTIPPDQPTTGILKISNHSGKAAVVRIQSGEYRFFQPGLTLPSARGWISFEPAELTLASQASTQIRYTITPPPNVAHESAGEYVAAIVIDTEAGSGKREAGKGSSPSSLPSPASSLRIVPRLAIPVYLKIQGREKIQVEISGLTVKREEPQEITDLRSRLRVETLLVNHGTIHVRPAGALTILGESGDTVQTTALGRGIPLLPTARLEIPTILPRPPAGRYKAVLTLQTQPDQWMQKEVRFEVTKDGRVVD